MTATYRLSPLGRRTALLLMFGALAIWLFAIWSFGDTLGVSYNPLRFWGELRASLEAGLGLGKIVPALLMLVLIVATPLLIWNILEEYGAAYTVTPEGLRFESLGVALTYPWAGMRAIERSDEDADEPLDEVLLDGDYTGQIKNPLLRFLHGQAYGRRRLPIYAGLERREELLTEIRNRAGLVAIELAESATPEEAGA
jgi:4-amino-4-deoxy-L-arabinose transferase-like glycosyltransferase